MHEIAPINPWGALAYLVAGVFFILALRGLSSPASSQRGNRFGIVGMTIAVVTTLLTHIPFDNVFPTPGVPAHDTSGLDFAALRSEEHTSELQSLMRNSYADFCLKKNKQLTTI